MNCERSESDSMPPAPGGQRSAMRGFWDERFASKGAIWGEAPSPSADEAIVVFGADAVYSVLVPGCAYGRHCRALARAGFDVTGLDASEVAIGMAQEAVERAQVPNVRFVLGEVTAMPFDDESFDAIYERALLHLLLASEREAAIAEYHRVLRPGGLLYLTDFSTDDAEYGQGTEVESGTFDVGKDPVREPRHRHFFTEDGMRSELRGFEIRDLRLVDEAEMHGDHEMHSHRFWRAVATKA